MQCPYCSVEYSLGESCHCHPMPPAEKSSNGKLKVNGPWGETVEGWSLPPEAGQRPLAPPSRAR